MSGKLDDDTLPALLQSNWSYRWIVGKSLSPLRVAAILSAWYLALYFASRHDGALLVSNQVGLFSDTVMYALLVVLVFLALALRRLLNRFRETLDELPSLVSWSVDSDERAALLERIQHARSTVAIRTTRSRVLHLLTLGFLTLLVWLFQVHLPHVHPQPVTSWALSPHRFPTAYLVATAWAIFYWVLLVGNALWYGMASALQTQLLLRGCSRAKALIVRPLAPDRKGGLGVLADFHHSVTVLAASGMVIVLAWLIRFGANLPWLLGFFTYVIFLSLLYFLPLTSVHRAMLSARDSELKRLEALFSRGQESLPKDTSAIQDARWDPEHPELGQAISLLAGIDSLYRRAESMPVWPLNPRMVSQFLTIVLIPFVLWIVQVSTEDSITRAIHRLFD